MRIVGVVVIVARDEVVASSYLLRAVRICSKAVYLPELRRLSGLLLVSSRTVYI